MQRPPELNPYAPSASQLRKPLLACESSLGRAERTRYSMLYRTIYISPPVDLTITYSGLYFRQTILFNSVPQWFAITWIWFEKRVEFENSTIIPGRSHWLFEIDIGRGLKMRRFSIQLDGETIYLEDPTTPK